MNKNQACGPACELFAMSRIQTLVRRCPKVDHVHYPRTSQHTGAHLHTFSATAQFPRPAPPHAQAKYDALHIQGDCDDVPSPTHVSTPAHSLLRHEGSVPG